MGLRGRRWGANSVIDCYLLQGSEGAGHDHQTIAIEGVGHDQQTIAIAISSCQKECGGGALIWNLD